MAKAGVDLKTLPELLDPAFALVIENYFITNSKGLSKRKGKIGMTTVAGNKAITMYKVWKGFHMFAYDTTLAAYDPVAKTVTTIKSDWTTNDPFSGAPYGDFFFVGNIGDKIHYVTEAAGVFAITEIATAPKSGVITAIGARILAGVENGVYYSNVDVGTDPPCQTWTPTLLSDGGGTTSFRNGGTVRAICSLNNNIVAFGDFGKWAFAIRTIDSAGTLTKIEQVIIDRIDMGGARGAISTPKGVFYVNEGGLWQLMMIGQSDVPLSDQEQLTSVNLGTDYFNDIDLSSCDLVYYTRYSSVLLTCAKESTQNNHVIVYNPDAQAISTFKNWNISRWVSYQDEIYGASSIKTTLYHCFAGGADDGVDIGTRYIQELRTGNLWSRQMFYGLYIKGLLHQSSDVKIAFDIYDKNGKLKIDKLKYSWTNDVSNEELEGWGEAEWGEASWGGDANTSGMIDNFAGMRGFIRNYQRLIIKITEGSSVPHRLDWFSVDTRSKANIRRRNLTLTT